MAQKMLGNSGIEVSPLAFGGNVFGWTVDQETSFKLLDAWTDAEMNFIDTADVYSRWVPGNAGGESESIIGNWLEKNPGKRGKVVIATKVGIELAEDKKGLSKSYIMSAIDASLTRLKTDYVDLYQAHRDDPETPLEETLSAFDDLIKAGKVRAVGASNYDAARLSEALRISQETGYASYQTLQPLYNLYDRSEFERTLEPICLENGLGVIGYYSLASGFLTGKYRSEADLGKSPRGQGVKKYLTDRGLAILAALDKAATAQSATPTQIALAWLMNRHSVTAPIVSATSLEQLEDLVKSTRLSLTDDTVNLLNQASSY